MTKTASLQQLFRKLAPVFLVLSIFVVYLFSIAPDLTWAHDGTDGGDLITAAATGGVAHPTGYPTFLFLAHLFQFLPVGTIAYRTNLMSAIFTALTALLIYDLVVASPNSPAKENYLAGLIAGYAYGFSPLAWSQAVITEVYPLHIFFVTLILWLLVGRFANWANKFLFDIVVGLTMGIAMGNHLTSAALLPVVLLTGLIPPPSPEPKEKKSLKKKKNPQPSINWASIWASLDWASFGRRFGLVVVGLSLAYASIIWRAGTKAPINWGYAIDLNNLWWLISGSLYGHLAFSVPIDESLLRVFSVAQLLLTQFGVLGLLVGIYQLFRNFSPSRLILSMAWVALTNTIFSLGYDSLDSFVYLMPLFCVFAIWIGFGVGDITTRLAKQKNWLALGISGILLVSFWGMAMTNYPKLDLSADHRTQKFGKATLTALPPQAIVLTNDRALFTLWYYHFVLKERQDISLVARGLLPNPWYINVLHYTYSTLNISLKDVEPSLEQPTSIPTGVSINQAEAKAEADALAILSNSVAQVNPTRPVCNVTVFNESMSVVDQMSIVCYLPASQKANTPFISITKAIDTIDTIDK